jgi:NADH dehydrogenase [ubiquinone] 1 alpha subcomplex assembly factor 5
MTNAITPFDRKLVAQHRNRAASQIGGADFLIERAADEISGRLANTNRQFNVALDLGCHQGTVARKALSPAGVKTILSTDISPEMLAAAPAQSGLRFVSDEEFLPVRANSLDLAASALSLHWVNDLPGALVQIRKSLKPDGLFLGALFGGETLHELRHVLAQAEEECDGGTSPRVSPFADFRDLGALLQRAGFALPVVDADLVTVRYDTVFHLFRDLRAMGETNALNARRRVPLKRSTLMRAANLYHERFADADGRLRASFEILYATGWAPHESQQKPLRPGSAAMKLADALKTEELSIKDNAPKNDKT